MNWRTGRKIIRCPLRESWCPPCYNHLATGLVPTEVFAFCNAEPFQFRCRLGTKLPAYCIVLFCYHQKCSSVLFGNRKVFNARANCSGSSISSTKNLIKTKTKSIWITKITLDLRDTFGLLLLFSLNCQIY